MAADARAIYAHDNLSSFLKAELATRCEGDGGYSLRQFARDLGISPAFLSQLISRKKMLSPARCLAVGERLGLGGDQKQYFYLLAQRELAPTAEVRARITKQLGDLSYILPEDLVDADRFRAISDWYHVAILEMTFLDDFDGSAEQAGRRLGIAPELAREAIERLLRLGLLCRGADGRLAKVYQNARFLARDSNAAFGAFHRQMTALAMEAMEAQPLPERFIMSQTFCIEQGQLDEARQITRDYLSRMASLFATAPRRQACYQLNVQFFNLSPGVSGRPKS